MLVYLFVYLYDCVSLVSLVLGLANFCATNQSSRTARKCRKLFFGTIACGNDFVQYLIIRIS